MNVGVLFDWMGRIFGIAFLLFMLLILFFPNWRDPLDDADASHVERSEESAAQPGPEQEPGTVLIFPAHRRVHR